MKSGDNIANIFPKELFWDVNPSQLDPDHGAWAVVRHLHLEAKIPVLQLSIDYTKRPQYHYELAKELYALRKKGVLVIGSGNMVHNLGMVAWDKMNEPGYG